MLLVLGGYVSVMFGHVFGDISFLSQHALEGNFSVISENAFGG